MQYSAATPAARWRCGTRTCDVMGLKDLVPSQGESQWSLISGVFVRES